MMDPSLRNVQKLSLAFAVDDGELIAEVQERYGDGSSVSYLADVPALQCIITAVTQGGGRLYPTAVGWVWTRNREEE